MQLLAAISLFISLYVAAFLGLGYAAVAIGVVMKNGWAYRNAVDGAPADFLAVVRAAFLAGRFELLAFLAIDLPPKVRGVLDVTAAASAGRGLLQWS